MTPRLRAPIRDRRALRAAVLACAALAAMPARAEPVRAVVELFTSQGCGACRAADPVLRDLARKPGVVALTLPVTYWDYLGWKDTLALRPLTERQRAYARGRGRGRSSHRKWWLTATDSPWAPTGRPWTG